jgi:hypothetical protein
MTESESRLEDEPGFLPNNLILFIAKFNGIILKDANPARYLKRTPVALDNELHERCRSLITRILHLRDSL